MTLRSAGSGATTLAVSGTGARPTGTTMVLNTASSSVAIGAGGAVSISGSTQVLAGGISPGGGTLESSLSLASGRSLSG